MSGLESDFQEFMVNAVVVTKKSGVNAYGEDLEAGPATVYPAMVVKATKQIRTKDNQVKVSTAQVYLMNDYNVQPDDQITLPDGTKPVILHIGAWTDTNGPYVQVVYT